MQAIHDFIEATCKERDGLLNEINQRIDRLLGHRRRTTGEDYRQIASEKFDRDAYERLKIKVRLPPELLASSSIEC